MEKSVLIIDDTKNIRNLLTTCLEIEGFKVSSATDGTEALMILENSVFDLIFLDIKLPGMSGTEVLRKMRSVGINTPVIIMTAFATVKNAVDCTKLGAAAYLQKPFTANKIKCVLEELSLHSINDSKELAVSINNSTSEATIACTIENKATKPLPSHANDSCTQTNSNNEELIAKISASIAKDSLKAATELIKNNDSKLCIEILKNSLSVDPTNSKIYNLLGIAYMDVDASLSKKFIDMAKILSD